MVLDRVFRHAKDGGHRFARDEDMAVTGGESHLSWGIQQIQQIILKGQGQVPVSGAVAEGEITARKTDLQFFLHRVADLLHRRGGAAIQGKGLCHVHTLGPADAGIHLRAQSSAEQHRAIAAIQVIPQCLAREQKSAFQPNPLFLHRNSEGTEGIPGCQNGQQFSGTGYTEGARVMQDWDSRIYHWKEMKE